LVSSRLVFLFLIVLLLSLFYELRDGTLE